MEGRLVGRAGGGGSGGEGGVEFVLKLRILKCLLHILLLTRGFFYYRLDL